MFEVLAEIVVGSDLPDAGVDRQGNVGTTAEADQFGLAKFGHHWLGGARGICVTFGGRNGRKDKGEDGVGVCSDLAGGFPSFWFGKVKELTTGIPAALEDTVAAAEGLSSLRLGQGRF